LRFSQWVPPLDSSLPGYDIEMFSVQFPTFQRIKVTSSTGSSSLRRNVFLDCSGRHYDPMKCQEAFNRHNKHHNTVDLNCQNSRYEQLVSSLLIRQGCNSFDTATNFHFSDNVTYEQRQWTEHCKVEIRIFLQLHSFNTVNPMLQRTTHQHSKACVRLQPTSRYGG